MLLRSPTDPAPVLLVRATGSSPLRPGLRPRAAGPCPGASATSACLPPSSTATSPGTSAPSASPGRCPGNLDAALVAQRYSRLVIDCNRAEDHPGSIPVISERTAIPGNRGLAPAAAEARRAEILRPYQAALAGVLARARPSILVAVHSFTPVYLDEPRPWQAGVLYTPGQPLRRSAARPVPPAPAAAGRRQRALCAVPDLGLHRAVAGRGGGGCRMSELEIRQDLIADRSRAALLGVAAGGVAAARRGGGRAWRARVMRTRAAIAFEAGSKLVVDEVDLEGPHAGEVLDELRATGLCHTDKFTLSRRRPGRAVPVDPRP